MSTRAAARWRNDRGPLAGEATLEALRRHVRATSVDEMGAARAWAGERALWMPQRIDTDGRLDPTVVAAPFDGEIRIVAEPEPGELSVLCWAPATNGWDAGAEGSGPRFVTIGAVEDVDAATAATMWLKRPWTRRAFMSWSDDGRHFRFRPDGLGWKWGGSVHGCQDDLEVPAWLRDAAAVERFEASCQPVKMRQVHAVAASLTAQRAAQELQGHLAAGAVEQRLAARAWAQEHPLWSLDGIAASKEWHRSSVGVEPEHGEVWVSAGGSGQILVGWWDERGDELSSSYEFRVQAEIEHVDPAAVASMWVGDHRLESAPITAARLEELWDEAVVDGGTPRWLRDDNAARRVRDRRTPSRRRARPSVSR